MISREQVCRKIIARVLVLFAMVGNISEARGEPCLSGICPQLIFKWRFAAPAGLGGVQRGCDGLYNIPDVTCDKEVRIVVLGDSIVAGVGDERYGNSGGGYIRRTGALLPGVAIAGVGTSGQNSLQLYQIVKSTLSGGAMRPRLKGTLLDADIIVIDIGRNDWWRVYRKPNPPVNDTFARLNRLQRYLRDEITTKTGRTPIVILSRLLLPNRTGQGAWVGRLNARLKRGSSLQLPATLRFDLISKSLYNNDQLHPTAVGYDVIAEYFRQYLLVSLPLLWEEIRSSD